MENIDETSQAFIGIEFLLFQRFQPPLARLVGELAHSIHVRWGEMYTK